MRESTRRKFLHDVGVGIGTAAVAGSSPILRGASSAAAQEAEGKTTSLESGSISTAIDFRYSPLSWQTAYCFPDDHLKSVMGERGELRYGHSDQVGENANFPEVVRFSLEGMEADQVGWQRLEAPGVPIIHTRLDRPAAFLHITTFATRREGEGRVDNVILEVEPRTEHQLAAVPLVILRTRRDVKLESTPEGAVLRLGNEKAPPFLLSDKSFTYLEGSGVELTYRHDCRRHFCGPAVPLFPALSSGGAGSGKAEGRPGASRPTAGGGARVLAELEAL